MRNQDQVIRDTPPEKIRQALASLSRQLTITTRNLETCTEHVSVLEERQGILLTERWGCDHPRRIATAEHLNSQDYHKAIDNLERLVVMRLFELTKLNQSGTGEFGT